MDLLDSFKPLGDNVRELQEFSDAVAAVAHIQKIYSKSTEIIHQAFTKLLEKGETGKFQDTCRVGVS